MKKTLFLTLFALLFCGGLFCLYLSAQQIDFFRGSSGALVFDDLPTIPAQTPPASLLDRNLEECNERELLELKVATHRKLAHSVAAHAEYGAPAGSAFRLAESHAGLAAAEIELYRHTGDQTKLRIALKSRIEALTDKCRALAHAQETGRVSVSVLYESESQLLDALLEQRREENRPKVANLPNNP
jgi:hypothetical protein